MRRRPQAVTRNAVNGTGRRSARRQVKSRMPAACSDFVRHLIDFTSRQRQTRRTLLDWPRRKKLKLEIRNTDRRRGSKIARPHYRKSSVARPLPSMMLFKLWNQTTKPEPLRYCLRWRTRASLGTRPTSARLARHTQTALETSWPNHTPGRAWLITTAQPGSSA